MLKKLDIYFDRFSNLLGLIALLAVVLLILNVFYDAFMRYFFSYGNIAMQEMEWHLFAIVILLGLAYTFKADGHVRVDLFYEKFSPKAKAIVNIIGIVVFVMPLCLLIVYGSYEFVLDSYTNNEISPDPGGLKYRYIIKALIPVSFICLFISSIGVIVKNIIILKELK